jgi:predicted aconitase
MDTGEWILGGHANRIIWYTGDAFHQKRIVPPDTGHIRGSEYDDVAFGVRRDVRSFGFVRSTRESGTKVQPVGGACPDDNVIALQQRRLHGR